MQQYSAEWYEARRGKVTASRICDVMARTKKGFGVDRKHYMDKLVAERVTGQVMAQKQVASLDRRLELEPDARIAYEFYSDSIVEEAGFIEHPTIPSAGASPDGLVRDDGGVEIKCCDAFTHIEMHLTGEIAKDYVQQSQFGMACTGREWWDFVSFNPTMPEEGKLFVKRLFRDEIQIAEIETAVIEFLAEVDVKVQQVLATISGKSPLESMLEQSIALAEKSNVVQ